MAGRAGWRAVRGAVLRSRAARRSVSERCRSRSVLPGLRIGWIAGPPDLIQACWSMRDYISLSPGKLNDALAQLGMRHRERIVARNTEIIRANLATAGQWIAERSSFLSWTPPRGGLLALLKYDLPMDSLPLADKLALEYSVMLAPGSAFGYERHLRLGVGQRPDIFARAGRSGEVLRGSSKFEVGSSKLRWVFQRAASSGVEHLAFNQRVAGSIPARPTNKYGLIWHSSQWLVSS